MSVEESKAQGDIAPKMDPSVALHNLGVVSRMARLSADEHEMCAASFNRLAEVIGYVSPLLPKKAPENA